jgi:hypothetical protein
VLDPAGDPVRAGDDDSGEVLRLSQGYPNCKTILNLTAFMTGNDAFLQEDVRRDEKSFWLLGPEAFSSLIRRERERKPVPIAPRAFKEGGYYILEKVLRGRNVKVVFDCGPLGMRPMAGHGHADALSFALYLNGTPVFIDPGTYTYYKKGAWRDYFRGSSAHNTMRMDGRDQSLFGGLFLALKQAEAGCDEWTEGEKVAGRHSGYGKPGSPALHRRTMSFDGAAAALTVEDSIETSGEHLVELFFHLDGGCIPSGPVDGRFSVATPSGPVTLEIDPRLDMTVYFGDDVLPLGWQSPFYGKREKIFTVVGRRRIRGPEVFTARIGF